MMTISKEQVRQLLTPPIAYVNPTKSEIDIRRRSNFIYCWRGCDQNVYKGTFIIDSKGTTFQIKNTTRLEGVLFWQSLRVLTPVVEVLPVVEEIKTISVAEFKDLMIRTINKKPRAWSSFDTVRNIRASLEKCATYLDVMRVFNLKL